MPLSSTLLLCVSREDQAAELRSLLQAEDSLSLRVHLFAVGDPSQQPTGLQGVDLLLIDGSSRDPRPISFCRRLRPLAQQPYIPILYVSANNDVAARVAALEAGADAAMSRPLNTAELLAQLATLTRLKGAMDRLNDRTAEVLRLNRRLQQAYQQFEQGRELARWLQNEPGRKIPQMTGLEIAIFEPASGLDTGDFMQIVQIDEDRLRLILGDTLTQGIPSSLISAFVKRSLMNCALRSWPAEILKKVNGDLLEARPSSPSRVGSESGDVQSGEPALVMLLCVVLEVATRTLSFARAAQPLPVLIPATGDVRILREDTSQPGLLLGIAQATFVQTTVRLEAGDRVLLLSDGFFANFEDPQMAVGELLSQASVLRKKSLRELVQLLGRQLSLVAGEVASETLIIGIEVGTLRENQPEHAELPTL